jgi:3-hydroxyisobutyrate dehydrogenase-like beta-hydroxyacid dehydrogenase
MAQVRPKLHKTPLLVSGPDAEEALAITKALDMAAKAVPGGVGAASSNKMIRSVMMKGLEALVLECVLAGRKAGVDQAVLDSLDATYPGFGWKKRSAYMMERAVTHGIRRAAEMREAALTVKELGFGGAMASATADWEQRIGDLRLSAADAKARDEQDYGALADLILKRLGDDSTGD